ncbi:hypothetical protein ACMAZF_15355 [Psychrobium sp. nBUS_13]|uniref:hypothetical protein n=1 Tax=Psychrobium sp. nBUS_13 TaxID=3395319 RepID=UPI003EBE7547
MNKLTFTSLAIAFTSIVLPVQANTKLCNEINSQISKLDKHADDFYSLANYEFNDEKLLNKLKGNSRYFKDDTFEQALKSVERAINSDDKELMIKMAPVSRYLNDWNVDNCS